MNKKDYLSEVTKRIYNISEKQSVSTELESHIDEKTDFYIEIGYDDETAQEKAAEAMGETETVADQLAQLHNKFYNPALDIIVLILLGGIFGCMYYFAEKYAFGDEGMASVLLGACCFAVALMTGYCGISLYRKKLVPILFSVLTIGGASVFNYYILSELDLQMSSDFSNLMSFIISTDIDKSGYAVDEKNIIISITALSLVALAAVLFGIIYYIKVRRLANTLTDNRIMRGIFRISIVVSAVSLLLGVLFCVKCAYDVNKLRDEYVQAYSDVYEMTADCNTQEDIIAAVENSDYNFDELTDKDGNLTGYSYSHNLVEIDISFYELSSMEEIKQDYLDAMDKASDWAILLEDTEKTNQDIYFENNSLYNQLAALLYDNADAYAQLQYAEQCFCTVELRPNTGYFSDSYDKVTTSFLEIVGEDETEFRLPENNRLGFEEKYDFCKSHVSSYNKVTFKLDEFERCTYKNDYLFGNGDYKIVESYYFRRPDENVIAIRDRAIDIASALRDNPDMTSSEIAAMSNSTAVYPEISKDELMSTFNVLGTAFDDLKQFLYDTYDYMVKYDCGDWSFMVIGKPYKTIYVYDSRDNYLFSQSITDNYDYVNYDNLSDIESVENLKKVSVGGLFYDKEGYVYNNVETVPYYTSDGRKYYYYCKTIEDKTHTVGNTKEYYLTDRQGSFYKADNCFIDENGYLYFNTLGSLTYDKDEKKFVSSSGEKYTKAFETSWNEKGELIYQSDDYNFPF